MIALSRRRQLPPALARQLESRGHQAEHIADVGLARATDPQVRATAVESSAVIVTKDEDFAVHHLLHGGPSLVWVRIGNTRRAELLRRFDAALPEIVAASLIWWYAETRSPQEKLPSRAEVWFPNG